MISRELSRALKFYECCLSWYISHGHPKGGVVKLHCTYSSNFSKAYCQAQGCFPPDEVIGQDGGEPLGCYLKTFS